VTGKQKPTSNAFRESQVSRGVGNQAVQIAGEPSAEEAAAIIAVLSLMQREAPSGTEVPRTSAWARAGRREAVRPWTRQE
jgi:hypothetical protein